MDHGVTRIGVITDAHANLPATLAAIAALDSAGCDRIIHTGDAIGIGPHPREVLELVLARPDITCIMGNHDELFAFDMLKNPPAWLSAGELEHQRWTHSQLPGSLRAEVSQWPYAVEFSVGRTSLGFQHYARNDGGFGPVSWNNLPGELDDSFEPVTDVVFYGHHHPRSDVQGSARYINPGALGTNPSEGARYALITCEADSAEISLHAAAYDVEQVRSDLIQRRVPEADFILRVFLAP